MKKLGTGLDTLYIGYSGLVKSELRETLRKLKQQAVAGETPTIDLGGWRFEVQPHGTRPCWSFILKNDELTLKIVDRDEPGGNGPAVFVEFRSVLLRDIHLEAPNISGHYMGRRFTGLRAGKGDLMLRIYDKTAEIAHRKKSWFWNVWGLEPGQATVWRVEFQIRRGMLKEFRDENGQGIETLDDLLMRMDSLWSYLVKEWFSLRELDACRVDRRTLTCAWGWVRSVSFHVVSWVEKKVNAFRQRVSRVTLEQAVQSISGFTTSIAAVLDTNLEETMKILSEGVKRHLVEGWKTPNGERVAGGSRFWKEVNRKRVHVQALRDHIASLARVEQRLFDRGLNVKEGGAHAVF